MPVSEPETGWYHCGRCGNLFRGEVDPGKRGICPSCGQDPVIGTGLPEAVTGEAPRMVRRKRRRVFDEEFEKPKNVRRGSRRKARAVAIFVGVWVVLLAILAVVAKKAWPDVEIATEEDPLENYSPFGTADDLLIRDEIEGCSKALKEFLEKPEPESRVASLLGGTSMVGKITRHQRQNEVMLLGESLLLLEADVLHTPVGPAIETLWKLDDERSVEAVFFETEEGEWKIDWENMVRYSTEPWALFVAGAGASEGEFRLLARERVGAGDLNNDEIGLVLYAPKADAPGEAVAASTPLKLSRESEIGRRLVAAFDARKRGLGAFGSKIVEKDPEGMIRVRARVSRHQEDNLRVFRIEELSACHWLHFDGEEMPAAGEPKE